MNQQFDEMDFNLRDELLKKMISLGFKQTSIDHFTNSEEYIYSGSMPSNVQLPTLMTYFNNLFLSSGVPAPVNIRRALAASILPIDWLADMTQGVLSYLLLNEDVYFTTTTVQ